MSDLQSHARRLTGFGMNLPADGYLFPIANISDWQELLARAKAEGRRIVLRGAGLSYGDAAVGAEHFIADFTQMNKILAWDPGTGIIRCEGGTTLEQIWQHCLPGGFWLPVVSGTTKPTLAGAIAMNIHGKNAHHAGTLGEYVHSLELGLADGSVRKLSPSDPEFRAVVGGAGQFGAILSAELQMKRVPSGLLEVKALKATNLKEMLRQFGELHNDAEYLVGWIDAFATETKLGRGLIHSANPTTGSPRNQLKQGKLFGLIPREMAWKFMKPLTRRGPMKLINSLKYKAPLKKIEIQTLSEFNFLLDSIPNWQWSYTPGALIQFQVFVDYDRAEEAIHQILSRAQEVKLEPFLAVLKRHRSSPFLIDYAGNGYSLALDFRITDENESKLQALLRELTTIAFKHKGRFYWAKDSILKPADIGTYLAPNVLCELQKTKKELDPENLFTSALAERLELFK